MKRKLWLAVYMENNRTIFTCIRLGSYNFRAICNACIFVHLHRLMKLYFYCFKFIDSNFCNYKHWSYSLVLEFQKQPTSIRTFFFVCSHLKKIRCLLPPFMVTSCFTHSFSADCRTHRFSIPHLPFTFHWPPDTPFSDCNICSVPFIYLAMHNDSTYRCF